MKEPDGKGLATHPGPESCAGPGSMAGEALTRVRAGHGAFPLLHRAPPGVTLRSTP